MEYIFVFYRLVCLFMGQSSDWLYSFRFGHLLRFADLGSVGDIALNPTRRNSKRE